MALETKKNSQKMKGRIEKKKCIYKRLSDDFNKHFYFQFGGFKTLVSEVF